MTEIHEVITQASAEAELAEGSCSECGSRLRPRSERDPDLCERCGDGVGLPQGRRIFWSMPGHYDAEDVLDVGPGQGGVHYTSLMEERRANRRPE